MSAASVDTRVLAVLDAAGVDYALIAHRAIQSAEEASSVRGTPLAIGGKALVMKIQRIGFAVVVIGGDRRLDGRAVRTSLGVQRYRFARRDELHALTGLEPGAVPPFGAPVFDLPLIVDEGVLLQPEIAFTIGVPTRSVRMATADWARVAQAHAIAALTARS